MSLDTLLKAAQFIELQEQSRLLELSPTPSHGERFQRSQQQHFYDNVNNSRSNSRHHQVSSSSSSPSSSSSSSSPPTTYGLSNGQMMHNNNNRNNSNNNNNSQLSHTDFDYGVEAVTSAVAATAVNGRSTEGRTITEEPYLNGHSSPSSFIMIKTPQSSTTITTTKHIQQQGLQSDQLQLQQQQQQQLIIPASPKSETLSSLFSNNNNNNTTITIVDNNKNAIFSNGNNTPSSNGNASLAALSAAAATASTQPIVINVTNNRTATNAFSANNLISHATSSTIRNSPPMGVASAVAAGTATTTSTVFRKKFIPLTPPPMSNRKIIESSRIRSFSLSSNKITAHGLVGSNGIITGNNSTTPTILHNHHIQQVLAAAAEDSSQSSLNLSSSGYLSAGSINSNIGGLNLSTSGGVLNGVSMMNGSPPRGGSLLVTGNHLDHPMSGVASSAPTSSGVHQLHGSIGGCSRRRTISSNSNGAGTREVHNKLEKHRRAQLKECFEQLKGQLQLKDEERKKTSNLAILGAALKHVMALKFKEQELEQKVEQLAKEKINAQKKIVSLKRELGSKVESVDFSSINSDIELGSIPIERVTEGLNDSISLSSGRGSMLYSSSSSLSSGSGGNTMSSPLGAGMQTAMPTALSPVITQTTSSASSFTSSANNSSAISPNIMMMMKSSPPLSSSSSNATPSSLSMSSSSAAAAAAASPTGALTVTMPLSLTAKNISATSLTRGSPTPSTPSPSPSSSSGVSSSSSIHSSSPPIGGVKVVPNIPANGVKFSAASGGVLTNVSTNGNTFHTSPVINITSHSENNGGISSSNSGYNATASGMPLNMNAAITASIVSSCSTSSASPLFFSTTSLHPASSPSSVPTITTVSHSKEFNSSSGRNGLTRKTPASDNNDNSHFSNYHQHHHHQQQQQQQHKPLDEGEQPAKVFKVFNGIALGSMDKDNKLGMSATPLQLSQVVGGGSLVVSPFLTSSHNSGGVRLVNTNSLATIELSSGPSNQSRCNGSLLGQTSSPPNTGGAHLHKLLMSAVSAGGGIGSTNTTSNGNSGSSAYVSAAELGRLPGGAELNILPTAINGTTSLYRGNSKLAFANNGILIKGAVNDSNSSNAGGRGIHIVNAPVSQSSGLASIAVSQGQQGSTFAQLIGTAPQLAGKVNMSVGGQNLPLLGSQYLGSMKPMVMAVSNNSNQPTLSSSSSIVVPPTLTSSTAIVTGTTNGNAL